MLVGGSRRSADADWLIAPLGMKPRRRQLSVDLLPTISEAQEDGAQAWHPGHPGHAGHSEHPTPSLEDYVASIKELAQPAAFSACATLQVPGRPKHAMPAAPPPGAAKACMPRIPVALDDIALVFAADAKRDCGGGSCSAARDPLDWLFARAECDDLSPPGNSSAALCLL